MQRDMRSRVLPGLIDPAGAPFKFVLTGSIERRLHELSMQAGGVLRVPEPLGVGARDEYVVRSLMEEAITSSQLEGAATTREVAREMLRSQRPPRDRSERMILNNFLTMQRIREVRDRPLTREILFELHSRVTDGTLRVADGGGRFRRPDEDVVVEDAEGSVLHVPPAASDLPARLQGMLRFANEEPEPFVHPVLRAIALHFWLAYDHPFVDGNGRTARAIFYWSMLRHGFWLVEFLSISEVILRARTQYARAFLHTETDANDLTYFFVHQLEVIAEAVRSLHEYIERRTRELRETESVLRAGIELNHRQKALLRHALRHPYASYTIEGHRRSHAVAYATARADLLGLVEHALLEQKREGRRLLFVPYRDLAARVSGDAPLMSVALETRRST